MFIRAGLRWGWRAREVVNELQAEILSNGCANLPQLRRVIVVVIFASAHALG